MLPYYLNGRAVTLSRLLWTIELTRPPCEGKAAVLQILREYGFEPGLTRAGVACWLYYWAAGLVMGCVSLAEIPAPAHTVLESYLNDGMTRTVIDEIVSSARVLQDR